MSQLELDSRVVPYLQYLDPSSYSEDIKIDMDNLDLEKEKQPDLVNKWGRIQGEVSYLLKDLQEKLGDREADLTLEITRDPLKFLGKDFDSKKLTQTHVKSVILRYRDVKELRFNILEVQRVLDSVKSTVNALDHKRSSIRELINLWINNYHSGKPTVISSRPGLKYETKQGE